LEKSGAAEFVDKLPKKLDTQVFKIFERGGVEFSGGQAQKLAIARAICLKAPFIVLDEPTAALDPVAEFEIYQRFDKMVRDKATIYISHRMSSCRLCDVVVVFADGGIQQYGSHEE
jgi:ABC-type multidrug transport system fused ATPase/permease subunit